MSSSIARGDIQKIADLSGVNATTVSRIIKGETKNPGVETMAKIDLAAVELGLDITRQADEKQNPGENKTDSEICDSQNTDEIPTAPRYKTEVTGAGHKA